MSRMRWSKLKTSLEALCVPELQGRVRLHQARYRYTGEESGRVWVTIDGREVASFDTATYIRRRGELSSELLRGRGSGAQDQGASHEESLAADQRARALLRERGQYDDYEALIDLEAYLSLTIEAALSSPSPLVRALAMIDRRVGKRRLRNLAVDGEHLLVRELYLVRCQAGGIDNGAAV